MSVVAAAPEDVKAGKHMRLSDLKFLCQCDEGIVSAEERKNLKQELVDGIKENQMSCFYEECCSESVLELDSALLAEMKASNEKELAELDAKLEKAKKEDGEIEIMDSLLARADFYYRIGDKDAAVEAAEEALYEAGEEDRPDDQKQQQPKNKEQKEEKQQPKKKSKALSTGQKIDLTLKIIRVGLFHGDTALLEEYLAKAKALVDAGGDWDRRNRLKVYESAFQLMKRDFAAASKNMLSSIATFTCYELMTYSEFISRTVLVAMLALDRASLHKSVMKSSDVITVIRGLPKVREFLHSLHNCDYSEFMRCLLHINTIMSRDRFLRNHAAFYIKEMRVKAYIQFLVPYKSVKMASMADAFGVGVDFVDRELFRFISNGRLSARIDKTAGIVETNRPDEKNAQYQAVIKHGDALLNRIQKLARVINV